MKDLLDRGENLDDIEASADALRENAKEFKKTSKDLKWKFCCVNAKWTAILVITIIVIITVIVVAIVCTSSPDSCNSNSDNNDNNNMIMGGSVFRWIRKMNLPG